MKVKELQSLIRESVQKTLVTKYQYLTESWGSSNEAGYDQYGEHAEVPTDPSWFDTLSGTDDSNPQPRRGDPEVRRYLELFKGILRKSKKSGKVLTRRHFSDLIHDFSFDRGIDFDSAWEIAHMALEELQDNKMLESSSKQKRLVKKKGK